MYGSKFTLKLYAEIIVFRVPSLQCSIHRTDQWTEKKNLSVYTLSFTGLQSG